MSLPTSVHLLHSIRCHFYVPTTSEKSVYMMTTVSSTTSMSSKQLCTLTRNDTQHPAATRVLKETGVYIHANNRNLLTKFFKYTARLKKAKSLLHIIWCRLSQNVYVLGNYFLETLSMHTTRCLAFRAFLVRRYLATCCSRLWMFADSHMSFCRNHSSYCNTACWSSSVCGSPAASQKQHSQTLNASNSTNLSS